MMQRFFVWHRISKYFCIAQSGSETFENPRCIPALFLIYGGRVADSNSDQNRNDNYRAKRSSARPIVSKYMEKEYDEKRNDKNQTSRSEYPSKHLRIADDPQIVVDLVEIFRHRCPRRLGRENFLAHFSDPKSYCKVDVFLIPTYSQWKS